MPAMRIGNCLAGSIFELHFDTCQASNPYSSGFWRRFWSSIHCVCPCHRVHLSDEQAKAAERRADRQAVTFFFAFLAVNALGVVVALTLGGS